THGRVCDHYETYLQSFERLASPLIGQDCGKRERSDMGDAAGDIMPIKPPIERNLLAVTLRDLCCHIAKSTCPHNQLNFAGDTSATTAFFAFNREPRSA